MKNTAQIVAADAPAHSPTGVERYHDEGYVSASVATIDIFGRIETALRARKLQSVELLRDPRVNPEGSWRVFGDTLVPRAEFGLLLSRVGVPLGEKELQLVILQINERDGQIDLREVRARRRASPRPGRVRPDTHRTRNRLSLSPRASARRRPSEDAASRERSPSTTGAAAHLSAPYPRDRGAPRGQRREGPGLHRPNGAAVAVEFEAGPRAQTSADPAARARHAALAFALSLGSGEDPRRGGGPREGGGGLAIRRRRRHAKRGADLILRQFSY